MTRSLLSLLVAAGLVVLVFGPRAASDVPDGRVRIQYWEKWTGLEGEQMRSVVDAFNATVGKEKGIWVEYVSMSQIDRKTLVSTAAGVPPDVAGLWDNQVRQFAAMDALEPLDDYAKAHGIHAEHWKPVYFGGCTYRDTLYALPSTPAATALHWNKALFHAKADELRAAGLDPDRPPRTLQELDRYADVLDTRDQDGRIVSAGYIPLEPGWYVNRTVMWFGGSIVDETGTKLRCTAPAMLEAFNWVRSYSERLGRDSMTEFRSGFGGFDSPQNPFLTGAVAMVKQGPWMANYIEKLDPAFNRWNVPAAHVERERAFAEVHVGMSEQSIAALLGPADEVVTTDAGKVNRWSVTIKDLLVTFTGGKASSVETRLAPAEVRRKHTQWGAAPFPSAVAGLDDVAYAAMDVLVIPRGSQHKEEAFEFIAFVAQQEQMERLCSMHCKNSPLREVSEAFIANHPNPYIHVFERLAASANARSTPTIPNWPEVADELNQVAQRVYLLQAPTEQILREAQARAQAKLDRFLRRQAARHADGGGEP